LVASLKISRALSYEEEVHKGLEYVPSGVEVPAPSNVTFSVVALPHPFDFVTSVVRILCLPFAFRAFLGGELLTHEND
jgi:hypothetical protein